jgi:hypothetical protein
MARLVERAHGGDGAAREEMIRLVKRARRGSEKCVPVVRELLKDPAKVDVLGGDLATQAQLALVHAAAGKDLAFREALARKLELLRQELAGPDPTPLERLLVERVVASWLWVHYLEVIAAQALGSPLKWHELYQRRIDHAHRRFLSAIRTLAQVRKLAAPVLQVNIAKKQVNIAGPVPTGEGG